MGGALDKDMNFESNALKCTFYKNSVPIVVSESSQNKSIFEMEIEIYSEENSLAASKLNDKVKFNDKNSLKIWHERLAHQNCAYVK